MNPTTEFDRLMKYSFKILYPDGSSVNYFKARPADPCYSKAVKPDYVIDGKKWIDFKLTLSYREKRDVAWRPSALYASLRKYVDHVANPSQNLIIVYGRIYGNIDDINFPILRGEKVLISDKNEFQDRIKLVPAMKILDKFRGTEHQWIIDKVSNLIEY